ncbi:hypothetical protein ASPZODRAFT_76276 [Penicilliopsis zonata CBS 506.65]|uniref:Ketoreductase domain-containing protein n=1 Tax=Penicilliopsis zonata CBS 506.65 TaxID=1073090 RepID=A0A1L9S633_9EURO|nr:hypothetical protein ASPZODRAFT_76276 [Penicilliopsis zonata CBS 506.65]OJJ42638.1 hypothetical protein ASPZODRAFT_76276 [Penicilliopsis zonata CBS 506.65]
MPTNIDPDALVKAGAFTKKFYRDIYPAIDPTDPALSQAGKVVVITGASRGLGRSAFAAAFARAGADAIILLGRSVSDLAETAALVTQINPRTKVFTASTDVTDAAVVDRVFQEIVTRFGVPHVLINNAGTLESLNSIIDSDVDNWWATQETNVKGVFVVTKTFLKHQPSPQAVILNLVSSAAQARPPEMSSYSMSKIAIAKFTEFLHMEHPQITSIGLDPGIIPTEMAVRVPFQAPFMKDTHELVGGTAVWLASGDKQYLSGRYISANWDMEELQHRKDQFSDDRLLTFALKGDFGHGHDHGIQQYLI